MGDTVGERILVIGNSGAGKSTLAHALAGVIPLPVVDLDLIHWENEGYGIKRDETTARRLVESEAIKPRWIIEGVFAWLAEIAAPRASGLFWLDIPWSACRANLERRGLRRGATEQDHAELIAWAAAYWDRQTSSSYTGHSRLFERFAGFKGRLANQAEIDQVLSRLAGNARR